MVENTYILSILEPFMGATYGASTMQRNPKNRMMLIIKKQPVKQK